MRCGAVHESANGRNGSCAANEAREGSLTVLKISE